MVNTIRNGQKVWPTCPECGCRLQIIPGDEDVWGAGVTFLTHFKGESITRDARGCICSEVHTYHINTNGKISTHYMY